jgi:hypothetical protein
MRSMRLGRGRRKNVRGSGRGVRGVQQRTSPNTARSVLISLALPSATSLVYTCVCIVYKEERLVHVRYR